MATPNTCEERMEEACLKCELLLLDWRDGGRARTDHSNESKRDLVNLNMIKMGL
jgi:hypothetical protein